MPERVNGNSWDAYMQEHLNKIPKGKESEYIAAVMVGYKNKNQDPPVAFSKKKAEKETASMMKSPLFQEQMKNNQAEMLSMMAAGQYDAMVRQTVSPVPVMKTHIEPAYKGLEEVQRKIADGTYDFTPTKEWNALSNQLDKSVSEHKENPEMAEAMQIVNLLKVYSAFKEYEASVPKNSPDRAKMNGFGLELLTALGGGPEVTSRRLEEHFAEADREMQEIEDEVNARLEGPGRSQPEPGPSL